MRKLRRRRCLELFVVAGAMALIAAAPAGALGAGEESSGSAVEETGTEPSSGSTEPAPPAPEESSPTAAAPPSTGWVPQGGGTEGSGRKAPPTRLGGSLGSGAGPKQAGSAGEESSDSGGSSDYYEPESPVPPTSEEPASKPRVASPVGSVEPRAVEASPTRGGHAAVGVAIPVALPASPKAVDSSPAPPVTPAVASTRDRVASGSGDLPLPVLIVCGLVLVYAGGRLLLGPVEPDLFRSGTLGRVRRAISRV